MTRFLQLGASLYVPATRPDLVAIGNRLKYPALRSVIFCTEDAIRAGDLPLALANLEAALRRFEPAPLLRFVRVRGPAVLRRLLQMDGVRRLTGFVLPKVGLHNLEEYFALLEGEDSFEVMLTLETAPVFDPAAMATLRGQLLRDCYRRRILSLRIGGNDLFGLLGMRRPRARTVYATSLGPLIAQLVTTFRPHGFNLTGPVFEYLDRSDVLAREVRQDLAHGLFGKTAIHPGQVPVIEAQYRVEARDLEAAEGVLAEGAPPVFRLHDAMCEPATHHTWAALTHARALLYGVTGATRRTWTAAPAHPGRGRDGGREGAQRASG
jgi:citrate lyase beta subunit